MNFSMFELFRRLGWVRFIGDRFEGTQVQGGQLPFVDSKLSKD